MPLITVILTLVIVGAALGDQYLQCHQAFVNTQLEH